MWKKFNGIIFITMNTKEYRSRWTCVYCQKVRSVYQNYCDQIPKHIAALSSICSILDVHWDIATRVNESFQSGSPEGYSDQSFEWIKEWRVLPHAIYSRTQLYIANSMGEEENWWLCVCLCVCDTNMCTHVHESIAVKDRHASCL